MPQISSSENTPVLQTQGLTVQRGGREVLIELDLSVPRGALASILGPNGAGKTTLLRACLGLESVSAGSLQLLGQQPASSELRSRVGYVPQAKLLDRDFPALVEEVVCTGLTGRWPWRLNSGQRNAVGKALEAVGALHLAKRSVARLSGGELQRTYLARGIVRTPELLLLDEPATGMDAEGEAEFLRLIEAYRRQHQATVIMVTHDWGAALHHASHLLVINRRAIYCGPARSSEAEASLARAFGHAGHAHPMLASAHRAHG